MTFTQKHYLSILYHVMRARARSLHCCISETSFNELPRVDRQQVTLTVLRERRGSKDKLQRGNFQKKRERE